MWPFARWLHLDGEAVCLKALRQIARWLLPGAARVLRNLHSEEAVNGLIQRLEAAASVRSRISPAERGALPPLLSGSRLGRVVVGNAARHQRALLQA